MARTTKYKKAQVKKRCCATSALHNVYKAGDQLKLRHARLIKVNTKRDLLAKIGKSADHFKGHICTDCIHSVETSDTCGHESVTSLDSHETGMEGIEPSKSCLPQDDSADGVNSEDEVDSENAVQSEDGVESLDEGGSSDGVDSEDEVDSEEKVDSEGEVDSEDEVDPENGVDSGDVVDSENGIHAMDSIDDESDYEDGVSSVDGNGRDDSVVDMYDTFSEVPAGTESMTDPVIILSLTNLKQDLDKLPPDIKALIAYELAASERSKIRSDALGLMNGGMREISSLHEINTIGYLQERNNVLSSFVVGLWTAPNTQKGNFLLPSGNLTAQVQNSTDIYKIAKAIESCMGLTTPVAVLPFHFREIVLLYSQTKSRSALTLMAASAPHGCYQTVKNWLEKLGQSGDETKRTADKGDTLAVFDNNQVLQRRWRICVDNRSVCSVITMVMFLDVDPEGSLQFQEDLKPSNWLWESLDEQKLEKLKEGFLNPVHQDTHYIKHFHPWLTGIIQQVVNEQSLVDGKCVDEVDREVAEKKQDRDFRTCPTCHNTQVERRKRKCPFCSKPLPPLQPHAASSNGRGNGKKHASDKGPIRAFIHKKNETTYNITYEKSAQRASEYSHLPEQHPTTPPEVTIGEPISLNPCSYESVAQVFRNIGKQAGIKKYGGAREWLSIVCDGLPYILGYQLVERTFVCELCNTSVQGLSERVEHQQEHEEKESGSLCNFTQEFDWVLLQPGPGHVEMNMLKTFVKFAWPVFWEGMVELFNFRSETAKRSARSVNDHHKGMALARIARESFAKELVLPYVRQEMLKENGDLSVAGYLKFTMDTVDSSNYALIAELTFSVLDAIFLYRAGLRCGDVAMIDAGRAMFAPMWCARSHPLYRQLAVYDSIMSACMPRPVQDFINRTKSFNLSGVPYSGEGADFKLEAVNRSVQHWIATNPTDKDWRHACANQPKLSKLKQAAQEEMGLKDPREHAPKSNVDLGSQIMAFRTCIRERDFISDHDEKKPLTSYGNEPLDEDLVDFAETAAEKEKKFLESFICHKRKGGFLERSSVPFHEAPIFVTPEERSEYNNIQNKSIKKCIELINTKIAGLEDEVMRDNFTRALEKEVALKRGKRQDYIDFYVLLEEYEMLANCDIGTANGVVNTDDCEVNTHNAD